MLKNVKKNGSSKYSTPHAACYSNSEAKRSLAEEYRRQKLEGNYYLESDEICRQTSNVKAAVCSLVFRYLNKKWMYKNQDKLLHLNHVIIRDDLSSCERKLTDTGDNQIMLFCPGRHYAPHYGLRGEDYIDEIHISHGFQINDIIIYQRVSTPNPDEDHFIVLFSIVVQWDTLVPADEKLFIYDINPIQNGYIVDENEAELKFFRFVRVYGIEYGFKDVIRERGITALRLFYICSTIIQNTYLRSIIKLDWKLIPEEPQPVISKVITQYSTDVDFILTLYYIPGTSNHYYKVSAGFSSKSIIFYRLEDTEVGDYVLEVHRPILMVHDVLFNERFIDDTDSNLPSARDSPESSERSDSDGSPPSEEDM